jgi:hypothetical protein
MRQGFQAMCFTLVALASQPLLAASEMLSGAASLAARSHLDFSVAVPRVMQMRLLGHPVALDITAEDIAHGSVTVSGPRVDLLVNDRLGYVLRAELVNAVFTAVRIAGLGSAPLTATRAGASLRMASMVGRPKAQPVAVDYELQLAADTVPGRYPWPVALSLQEP